VDLDLVARAREGEEAAFNRLAIGEIDRLYAIAYRIVGQQDIAEDAVQETLVAVWRDLPTLRDLNSFGAWITRVLVHTCYREARRKRRLVTVGWTGEREPAMDDRSASLADRDQIDRAFRQLSPEHRAVVVVTHYLGLSGPEAADALGVPPGTIKSRLHHATRALRAAIASDERGSGAPGASS
jgi:RNA polymerase sigma-70 factor (ECF subfamily)